MIVVSWYSVLCGCVLFTQHCISAEGTLCDETENETENEKTTTTTAELYYGYSLLRLSKLSGMNQIEAILNLREKYEDGEQSRKLIIFDDIILTRRKSIRLLTSPDLRPLVENYLSDSGISYDVVLEDVSRTLKSDKELNLRQRFRFYSAVENRKLVLAPNHYMTYDEIQMLLINWTKSGENLFLVQKFSIGHSYEGREMVGISINGDRTDLPTIWVDSGIEPATWLAPATALHIAYQIINSTNESAVKLRSNYRWYFVPVINPDGYAHSIESDRFWRKTRRPYETENGTCFGVDLNKNFENHWGGAGTTDTPCSARYRGPEPFSEIEAKNLKAALEEKVSAEGSLHAYISIQSYGQFIFSPYAGKDMLKPNDYDYLFSAGKAGLEVSKTVEEIQEEFRFGTPPDLRYPTKGAIIDWVKDVLKVNWTFAIDVMPTSESVQFPLGYAVPATMIYASGQQTFQIVSEMVDHMRSDIEIDLLFLYHGIRLEQNTAEYVREEL